MEFKSHKAWGAHGDEERVPLKTRSSVSNLSGLLRMGKIRTNRSVTLPQVNTRLQSLEKDYRKLLSCLCRSLSVPLLLFQNMATSQIGEGVSELVREGCVDTSKFLALFPPEIKHATGTNATILQTILEVSQTLQKFSQQSSTSSLSIMNTLHTVIRCLENAPHLYFDNHTTQVISWWFPQFIEILSVVLLLSDTNTDGNSQILKDTNTVESYFNCYRRNIVIVTYLLTGAYLVDQKFTSRIAELEKDAVLREQHCATILEEKTKKITSSIRKRLYSASKDTTEKPLIKELVHTQVKKSSNRVRCWKDIYESLPPVPSTCAYLFSLDIPQDLCIHLGMDIPDPSTRRTTNLTFAPPHPIQVLLEKVSKIGIILESIRNYWPISFSEDDSKLLMRTALVLAADTNQLCQLEVVPFAVPESWDNWLLFLGLLKNFLDYIILLVLRKASKSEVEDILGKMIVQTRFMNQLSKIEESEECILSIARLE